MSEPLELILGALLVWRASVFLGQDAFPPMAWLRERILRRFPSDDTSFTVEEVERVDDAWYLRGTGREVIQPEPGRWIAPIPSRWSKVLTCVACSSIWLAGGALALLQFAPDVWMWVSRIGALSALAVVIEAWRDR